MQKKTGTTLCILIYIYSLSVCFAIFFLYAFTFFCLSSFFFFFFYFFIFFPLLYIPLHISWLPSMHTLDYTLRFVLFLLFNFSHWLILFSISNVFVCIRVWLNHFFSLSLSSVSHFLRLKARRKWFQLLRRIKMHEEETKNEQIGDTQQCQANEPLAKAQRMNQDTT